MKKLILLFLLLGLIFKARSQTLTTPKSPAGKPITWQERQLIQPTELALILKDDKARKPLIFNIGVVNDIPTAQHLGGVSEAANLDKLKKELSALPKSTFVVVYCGCCPFERCPNVRPAMAMLNEMGFKQGRLLNLPTNLKTDWINQGYPVK